MRKLVTNVRRVVATVGVEILLLAGIGVMDVSAQKNSDTCACDDASCTCIVRGSDWQDASWINDLDDAVADDPLAGGGITGNITGS